MNLPEADSEASKEYVLTDVGTQALEDEGIAVPVEDQFQVFFDGIHRFPIDVSQDQIALPRDTDSGLLVELPAIPPNKPTVGDLKVTDLQRILVQQSGGRTEFGKDLISLKRISDDQTMLVSNRPFLSNNGRIKTFEQYSGYFVQDAELTRAYLDRVRPAK
ncbi:hypothetical protein [Tardiphaga robiniae]|uniref:hypothetical protein n=1 Tax=Tardiphaga robiniae TaxID=943830 RepID=UPI001112877A|nr:hypothetical protein [Tardiphaga robiniae]